MSHAWVGKVPWRREWVPTPVFLPGKSHGQRSLTDYSPWGSKEPDRTEKLTLSLSFITHTQTHKDTHKDTHTQALAWQV